MALYRNPSARVKVNGILSSTFQIKNGTRQGCPLSPILFILTLEPLLQSIRTNDNIKGIKIGQNQYKLAAFADDILFFLSNQHISLPHLLQELSLYKSLSNPKINYSKSQALNVSLSEPQNQLGKQNFPFKWTSDSVTSLGIQLPTNVNTLYDKDYLPLLQRIKQDLLAWHKGNVSWFGRAAIFKMNVLPRLLYLFQTIPIHIPLSFFQQLRKLCRSFVWAHKSPRINFLQLTKPKPKGGLGIPDLHKYYQACHLQTIVDWHIHQDYKDWIGLEDSFSQIPLSITPWINTKDISPTATSHPLIGPTLQSFHNTSSAHKIAYVSGPLYPVLHNQNFPTGLPNQQLFNSISNKTMRIANFLQNGKIIPYETLRTLPATANITFWEYIQLRHFIIRTLQKLDKPFSLKPFEKFCLDHRPQTHLISNIYSLMWENINPNDSHFCNNWTTDLNTTLTAKQWTTVFHIAHKGSVNVSTQENNYKLISRWYCTPSLLHKAKITTDNLCWRCQKQEGDLFHIWWTCP